MMLLPGHIFCYQLGNGCLVTGCCQGKGKRQYRTDQLVNAHAFFAEQPCQINAVEKADQAACKTGECEYDRAGDQGM